MGNRYCVYGWTIASTNYPDGVVRVGEYYYRELYRGQSLAKALWTAFRARRSYGCVKLEMR